jgi:threonine/homoserine/homoserine lactone efflux protein
MTPETAFIFAMSLALLWIKPGPGQAVKITRGLNDGFWPGFYVAIGIITACLVYFLIAVLGLKIVTNFFYDMRSILKFIGGAYFLYIGYQGLKNIQSGQWTGQVDKSNKQTFIENYTAGLLLSFSNPLDIVYFMGIMPTLVPVGVFSINDIILGATILIAVGLIVDVLVLLLVSQVKEALSNTSFVVRLNIVTSIGFILIGLFLFYSAFFMANYSFSLV